jgi:hypothetical protein
LGFPYERIGIGWKHLDAKCPLPSLDMVGVVGSSPIAPTIIQRL